MSNTSTPPAAPAPQQTCLNCRYWSMWDHHCTMQALGADNWQPVNPDTPACSEFQPEET